MDNVNVAMLAAQEHPVYPNSGDPQVSFSYVALRDLGEATARILLEGERHYYGIYSLSSTLPMSRQDMIGIVSKTIGKTIEIKQTSLEQSVDGLMQRIGLEGLAAEGSRDIAERMLLYYTRHGLQGNPGILEWILGRRATSISPWSQMQIDNLKS